jgi:hypothetical protein
MRRAFGIDGLAWPRCGGWLRRIATVDDPAVVGTILAPLGRLHPADSPGSARSDQGLYATNALRRPKAP